MVSGRPPLFGVAMTRQERRMRQKHKQRAYALVGLPLPIRMPRAKPPKPEPPVPEFQKDADDEILQLSLMRACWTRSEKIFRQRIMAICNEWLGVEGQTACRKLIKGETDGVDPELAFSVAPLVNMLAGLRKGREHVDASFRMAVAPKPQTDRPLAAAIPEGYVSENEAVRSLGVNHMRSLRDDIRLIAYARAVRVVRPKGRGQAPVYFCADDIESARDLLDQRRAARLAARVARLPKGRATHQPPGDVVNCGEVSRLTGIDRKALGNQGLAGNPSPHFPNMFRFGLQWFCHRNDLDKFLRLRAKFERLADSGWVDTRGAAARLSVTHRKLIAEREKLGIEPARFGHHCRYSPQHIEAMKASIEEAYLRRRELKIADRAERRIARAEAARERQRQSRAEQKPDLERRRLALGHAERTYIPTPRRQGIPKDGIPIREALLHVGLTERQFRRVREGRSPTPIPPVHKAEDGRLFCLPTELELFCQAALARNRAAAAIPLLKPSKSTKNFFGVFQ